MKVDAYYLDDNGNIQSSNLWSLNSSYSMSSDGYVVYNNELLLGSGTYTFSFNFSGSSNTADFRLYTLYEDQPIYDHVFTIVNGINYFTFTLNSSTTKILWYSNATGSYSNLMLNTGSTRLNYEPYGTWYPNDISNDLSYVFEGAQIDLYNTNSSTLVLSDIIHLTNNSIFVLQNDCPLISDYLNSYEGNSRYFYVKIYLNASINNFLVVDCYQDVMDTNLVVSSSTNSSTFERISTNDYIEVRTDFYYKELSYDGLYTTNYVNFSINLDLLGINYSLGYNAGYNDGYNSGILEGTASGKQSGYIQGYNAGYNVGSSGNNPLYGMVVAVVDAPINIFKDIFNFDILGINIAGVVFGIISLLIIIWLIKKML